MRKCVVVSLLLLLAQPLGCGTLLYRDRIGQPRGKLDVVVVLLDSIGLVYFVVPGLVAFAVDFATGTIYLPREPRPALAGDPARIETRLLGARSRDPRAIEQALREATGIELAARWDQVRVQEAAERESLAQRLLELDACARGAELEPAAESRTPAFRSCARP